MRTAPIILVPGFWLGAWAWDEVAAGLRAADHDVTALTLPGLESMEADRASVTFEDHVSAVCDAVRATDRPVVLAVHSGASQPGYAASDRVADRIAAMVYVDTAPGSGAIDPDFGDVEKPFPGIDQLGEEENLTGLSPEQLATFERLAIPEPGEAIRGWTALTGSCPSRPPQHRHRDRLQLAGLPGRRNEGIPVARRAQRPPRPPLDRPADEPLADVVAPGRAHGDHRRDRQGARPTSLGLAHPADGQHAGSEGRAGARRPRMRCRLTVRYLTAGSRHTDHLSLAQCVRRTPRIAPTAARMPRATK